MSTLITQGFVASFLAGSATGIGGFAILLTKQLSTRLKDTMLGFSAGVMISASFFSLIIPSLEFGEKIYHSTALAALITCFSILLGVGAIWLFEHYAPHEHFIINESPKRKSTLSKIWLFVIAMTIHNLPEGLSVGVSFGSGELAQATSLAIAIGLQNIPEGLAVSASLYAAGYRRLFSAVIALASGLVEPLGGLVGATLVTLSRPTLPWALAFSAGAMLFVISHEIIPETHRNGHQNAATFGMMIGIVLMLFLDVALV